MSNFTNSPLVKYTKLSPNHSGLRKQPIDTITIHCVVGHCSLETLGNIFAPVSRQASSNYGVDDNGNVGMYCEEKNRSWCTSSSANDQRAVTIEVASDTKHPYAITDGALQGTIRLCADICRRNGIPKLIWKNDKSLIGKPDQQNMTVHRWFDAKACPGDYIFNKLGYIADEVNKLLNVDQPVQTDYPKPKSITGDKVIWDFFTAKGLNAFAVAGLMGNLFAESGLRSNNLQNTFENKLGLSDVQYTDQVDSGAYTNFVRDSAGYGLAQWTFWSRKEALLKHCNAAKASIGDLQTQLDFLWTELQGFTKTMSVLKTAKSVQEASNIVLTDFERPANMSDAVKKQRVTYGQKYFDTYGGKTPAPVPTPSGFVPYLVKVTASIVNYRKGPGTNNPIVGQVKRNEVYTIVGEADGPGASKWGKLKSGAGWVSLDFCQRK